MTAMKPTRSEFAALVVTHWPGAHVVEADRGLKIIVGSEGLAREVHRRAEVALLQPQPAEQSSLSQEWIVRVFGFQRRRQS